MRILNTVEKLGALDGGRWVLVYDKYNNIPEMEHDLLAVMYVKKCSGTYFELVSQMDGILFPTKEQLEAMPEEMKFAYIYPPATYDLTNENLLDVLGFNDKPASLYIWEIEGMAEPEEFFIRKDGTIPDHQIPFLEGLTTTMEEILESEGE